MNLRFSRDGNFQLKGFFLKKNITSFGVWDTWKLLSVLCDNVYSVYSVWGVEAKGEGALFRFYQLVKKMIILKLEALLKERDALFRFVSQVRNWLHLKKINGAILLKL